MIKGIVRKRVMTLAMAGGLLALAACSDFEAPAVLNELDTYASDINMAEFSSSVDEHAVRVDVVLYGERLVAREVAIRSGDAAADEERIHARVVGFAPSTAADRARLTLNIDGLTVQFTPETRFVARDVDRELDYEGFIARIRAALAEGEHPAIVALRAPPDMPQAPDDGEFHAAALGLVGEGEGRVLSLNIDKDNLVRNETPPPDGWLAVLGLEIELRVSEGLTHIKHERPDIETKRFEGVVQEVSLTDSTVTLRSGVIVRILDGTVFKYEEGDEHRLPSLEAVARALEADKKVVTAGEGIVRQREPLVLVAIAIVFEIAPPPMKEFEGLVTGVDLRDSTVTLEGGTILRITAESEFRGETDRHKTLGSLEEVARAFDAGEAIIAVGVGIIKQHEPLVLEVLKVAFIVRPPPMEEFRGVVDAVDLNDSIVTLEAGTRIRVTAETEVLFEAADVHQLGSLEAVAEALDLGKTVYAAGVGEVVAAISTADTRTIVAHKIVFWLAPPDVTAFHGVVQSVDLTEHTFTLQDGTVVRVVDGTIIWFANADATALRSLEAVARALDAGHTVLAAGVGVIDSTDPLTIVARKVAFMLVPPGVQYFEGTIVWVDREARSFMLDNGATIRVVEGTLIVHEDGGEMLGSFDAVAEVVGSGGRVMASGLGLLETSDPLVLIAITVVFRI
jgi:predicted RNA-binding protein